VTAAAMSGVFRITSSVQVRRAPGGDPVATLSLAYTYGSRQIDNRPLQRIEASLWGLRASKLAPLLVEGALVFAVIEDVHIETFTPTAGAVANQLVGRIGRVEVVAPPLKRVERSRTEESCKPS